MGALHGLEADGARLFASVQDVVLREHLVVQTASGLPALRLFLPNPLDSRGRRLIISDHALRYSLADRLTIRDVIARADRVTFHNCTTQVYYWRILP